MENQTDSSNHFYVQPTDDNHYDDLDMRKTVPVPQVQNNAAKNIENGHSFQHESLIVKPTQKDRIPANNTKRNEESTHLTGEQDFQRKAEEENDEVKYGIDYYLARERLEKRLGVGCFDFNDIKKEVAAMQSEKNSNLEFKNGSLDEVVDEMTKIKLEDNSGSMFSRLFRRKPKATVGDPALQTSKKQAKAEFDAKRENFIKYQKEKLQKEDGVADSVVAIPNGLEILNERMKRLGEPIFVDTDPPTNETVQVGPHKVSPVWQGIIGGIPRGIESFTEEEFHRYRKQRFYDRNPNAPPFADHLTQLCRPVGGQQNGRNDFEYAVSMEDLYARREQLRNTPLPSSAPNFKLDNIEEFIRLRENAAASHHGAVMKPREYVDRRISAHTRYQVIKLLNAGYSICQVSKRLRISPNGVRYVRDRAAELGLLKNREVPKIIFSDGRINEVIERSLRENPLIKLKEIRDLLFHQGHPEMTISKIRYRLGAMGFQRRKMKRVQVISPQNRLKRLAARAFWESEDYDFRHYLFVDESTVLLGRNQQYCWVRKGEKTPCQGRLRHGSGWHVFIGLSWRGATTIIVWNSKQRMNSSFYCDNNIKDVVAEARHLFEGGQFQLVQDNHPAHVSKHTKEYLKKEKIDTFCWPAQSPDWNPPEFCFRDMKAYVDEKTPKTMEELRDVILEFWATKVTPSYCRKLIKHSINNIKKSYDGLNHEKDTPRESLYQK